jgi:hypothetical protein
VLYYIRVLRMAASPGLQLADLGRQIPRRLVRAGHALAPRTDEESRQRSARPPRTHPQLFPRRKQFSGGVVEGLNNKAKLTMRKA